MEITYDTGAKVILQGPVTYEVESPAGGFLSVGKLTARVENEAEGGRRKAEESNPQSPIPNPSSLSTVHYPLFTIKLRRHRDRPGYRIRCRGRSFWNDAVSAYFGQSKLEMRAGGKMGQEQSIVIGENESASAMMPVTGQGSSIAAIRRSVVDPERFVRQMPQGAMAGGDRLPMCVLTWFRLGEDDPAPSLRGGRRENQRPLGLRSSRSTRQADYSVNAAPVGSSLSVRFRAPRVLLVVPSAHRHQRQFHPRSLGLRGEDSRRVS